MRDVPSHRLQEQLGHRHQVAIVGVGLIELEHRELRVVLRRDALVPEVPVDLVDPRHAADDQPLEVQLGRDPQVQLHVLRVVVGHERPGEGAARDRLHHRRLDLEKAAIGMLHEPANRGQHAGARLEHLPGRGVDDQVEVPLPVPGLHVGQAVPLLGQRPMALGQELDAGRPHRQLVGPGAEEASLDPDLVADVDQRRHPEVPLGQRVLPHVDLYPLPAVGDDEEPGLPEASHDQDAAGRRGVDLRGLEIGAARGPVGVHERRHGIGAAGRVGAAKRAGVDGHAEVGERGEVGAPLGALVVLLRFRHESCAVAALLRSRFRSSGGRPRPGPVRAVAAPRRGPRSRSAATARR